MEELIQKIEAIMNDELLFRNPELTIRDVARELATNRLYVSRSGFVSETAFFRKFKQIMNDSPRSYMKKIKP